jgi:hypothetical protein
MKVAIGRRDGDPILARFTVATYRNPSLSEDGLVILAHRQVSLKHLVARITHRHHNRAHSSVRQELCHRLDRYGHDRLGRSEPAQANPKATTKTTTKRLSAFISPSSNCSCKMLTEAGEGVMAQDARLPLRILRQVLVDPVFSQRNAQLGQLGLIDNINALALLVGFAGYWGLHELDVLVRQAEREGSAADF